MANLLPIKTIPNPVLRKKTDFVNTDEIKSSEFQNLLDDMVKTMHEADGVGLAANQIGKSRRVTIISTKDGPLALINLKITHFSMGKESGEEGCLSVPGVWGMVERSASIGLDAYDRDGEKLQFTATGYFARVIQHEVDHLDGILFIDRATEVNKSEQEEVLTT